MYGLRGRDTCPGMRLMLISCRMLIVLYYASDVSAALFFIANVTPEVYRFVAITRAANPDKVKSHYRVAMESFFPPLSLFKLRSSKEREGLIHHL